MKHNYFFKLLIAIAFCSMGSLGFAADWYISSTGNDTSGDGSMGNPWASFSKAQAAAAAGDVIHVSGMIDMWSDPTNTIFTALASGTSTNNKTGITITKSLTIQGTSSATDGFNGTNGSNNTRLFQILSNITVTIKDLKLANAVINSNTGAGAEFGGAIRINNGNIIAENVIFESNSATGHNNSSGAALFIEGTNTAGTSFKNCVFTNNAANRAGAIYINNWGGVVTFENCSFIGNESKITNGGSALFIRSATNNTTCNIINSTFRGNKVLNTGNGGTIYLGAKSMQTTNINIINSTITENTTNGAASNCAGVHILNSVHNGTSGQNNFIGNLYIINSIIENNTAASNAYSDIALHSTSPTVCCTGKDGSAGSPGISGYVKIENSIIGRSGTDAARVPAGNYVGTIPFNHLPTSPAPTSADLKSKLAPFNTIKNYYPLLPSSEAIDYGSSTFLSIYSIKDQLGNTRPFTNGKCHAGAVEVKAITSTGSTNVSSLSAELSDLLVSGGELYIDQGTNVNSLSIAPGAKVTVSGTNALTASNGITLESNADATATLLDYYSSPTVNATVQQYVTAGRNWYISAPVAGSGVDALSRGNSVVEWNEATKAWDTKTSGNLLAGKGYIQVSNASQGSTGTIDFSGLTNSGEVTVSVNRTESGSSRGFNLVGNPYPSYLDWNGVMADSENAAAGLSSTFWYRTKNTLGAYVFTTYNGTSNEVVGGTTANTTINHLIPPMQAFWIRVNANLDVTTHNTTLKFKNTMRVHGVGDNNKFKAPKQNERVRLRLRLENGSFVDETLIYFDAMAADNFDSYDSPKMMNNSATTPDLYSKAGAERLVINGLSEVRHNMEIPLGFSLNAAAALKFKVSEIANLPFGTSIYLIDKEKNTQTELNAHTIYDFSTTTSTANNENRFSLLFRAPSISTDVDLSEKTATKVFVNATNQISILAFEKCSFIIYNALGQKLDSGVLNSKYESRSVSFDAGVYFVSVTVNGQNNIQKLIIR